MGKKMKQNKEQLDFDGQRDGEELLFVFRRHIIAMRKGFYLLLIPFAVSAIPAAYLAGQPGPLSVTPWRLAFRAAFILLPLHYVVFYGIYRDRSAYPANYPTGLVWEGCCRATTVKDSKHKL